jgi:RHS repeat-associated protein
MRILHRISEASSLKGNYAPNKRWYVGQELQDQEFSDGSGLEQYDYGARLQDPQLGRWHTQDKFSEVYAAVSPYQYAANNPIKIIDEGGHLLKDKDGNVIATSNANAKVIDRSYVVKNKDGSFSKRTVELKEVTVYTDAGTAVQAYQVIGAMVADAVDAKGEEFGEARPTPISKNMKANCLGYAFADGQVWFIDNTSDGSEFQKVLNDEYVEVDKPDANVAVIEWSSVGDFVRAHAGKVNKDGTFDHKDEIFAPVTGDDINGFMKGHDSGNGVYKVGTKYYRKKEEDKKADLPTVTVNGVRIVDEDQIKQILNQLGVGKNL